MENLLEIRDLTVELMSVRGIVYALSGVDLAVRPGEIHGLRNGGEGDFVYFSVTSPPLRFDSAYRDRA